MAPDTVSLLTVDDDQVVAAMRLIWERMKIIIEPSCATVLAVALSEAFNEIPGDRVGLILTGGNVDEGDADTLELVEMIEPGAERHELRQRRFAGGRVDAEVLEAAPVASLIGGKTVDTVVHVQ